MWGFLQITTSKVGRCCAITQNDWYPVCMHVEFNTAPVLPGSGTVKTIKGHLFHIIAHTEVDNTVQTSWKGHWTEQSYQNMSPEFRTERRVMLEHNYFILRVVWSRRKGAFFTCYELLCWKAEWEASHHWEGRVSPGVYSQSCISLFRLRMTEMGRPDTSPSRACAPMVRSCVLSLSQGFESNLQPFAGCRPPCLLPFSSQISSFPIS